MTGDLCYGVNSKELGAGGNDTALMGGSLMG